MTEREAAQLLELERHAALVPPHAHRRATSAVGLLSPGDRPIGRGDPFTVAFGSGVRSTAVPVSSSRTRRSCPTGSSDYVEQLVAPYFEAVAEWYEALRVGQDGGELQAIVDRQIGDPFFGTS